MYRDDPLDDEVELRELVGDGPVDRLRAATGDDDPVLVAIDVLRLLQGWVDDGTAGAWFVTPQQRLGGRTPVDALVDGEPDDVLDAAQAWAAAQG